MDFFSYFPFNKCKMRWVENDYIIPQNIRTHETAWCPFIANCRIVVVVSKQFLSTHSHESRGCPFGIIQVIVTL